MIQAVLFDGDQTLWDFERVMRGALTAVADELRAARPGPFADGLSWQDLEHDRTAIGAELEGVEYNLARLRMLGFARTLARRRAAEDGDVREDEALAAELGASYFAHRDRDPALFPDTLPGLDALRADYRLGLQKSAAPHRCPSVILMRATGFDLPALTPSTLLSRYAMHRAASGGGRATNDARRRRFCAMAARTNSSWAPRGPRSRSRPSLRMRFR